MRYFGYTTRARKNIDIAKGKVTKVLVVAYAGKLVFLAGEDARSSRIFTCQTKPSDACEQIDESEPWFFTGFFAEWVIFTKR